MKRFSDVMNHVGAYRMWQAPFAEKKLHPMRKHNDIRKARRVLDVGCGPGTNTAHFKHSEYLGLDWNQSYVDYAQLRFGREFIVTDVCSYKPPPGIRYDFILVNSFFHHIDDENSFRILAKLKNLLSDDGHVHILDLVMPKSLSVARLLARLDRGNFARSLEKWQSLLSVNFELVIIEPYPLTAFGITLWNMFYFKGKARK